MTAETSMTLDEIVAQNLERMLDEFGFTASNLAKFLGVEKHVVYDYLGARGDRGQRAFRWSELVALCAALDVPFHELVLPREDVTIRINVDLPADDKAKEDDGWKRVAFLDHPTRRDTLSLTLFEDVLHEGASSLYLMERIGEIRAELGELMDRMQQTREKREEE